jgi:hypothetical protein
MCITLVFHELTMDELHFVGQYNVFILSCDTMYTLRKEAVCVYKH